MIFYRKIIFFILIVSYLLSLDNFRHVKNITSLINSTAIQNLNDERLLIATTGGIYTSDYNGLNLIDYTDNLEYANISTLIKDNENIWLGGGDGNIQILDSGLNLKFVIDYIPFNSIKEIIFYDDNSSDLSLNRIFFDLVCYKYHRKVQYYFYQKRLLQLFHV